MKNLFDNLELVYRTGFKNSSRFLGYKTLCTLGWYRYCLPQTVWKSLDPAFTEQASSPFSAPQQATLLEHFATDEVLLERANRILKDEFLYFGHRWHPRPRDWKSFKGKTFSPTLKHWSETREFENPDLDIKYIWEPSRFDWAYDLGRAWVRTRDPRYCEKFWSLLDDWRTHNPPNQGPNWKCAQECSFRLIALVWAQGIFSGGASERSKKLWETVAFLSTRIEKTLLYSKAQRNNHLVSEALALYLAGTCLPRHPRGSRWRSLGKTLLLKAASSQVSEDGSYIQHSFNYTRLALRLFLVALYVSNRTSDPWPESFKAKVSKMVEFLFHFQEQATGRMPNYGENDGSNVLSLSSLPYSDFRPVCQLGRFLLGESLFYGKGAWNEELLWYDGKAGIERKLALTTLSQSKATPGGYYKIPHAKGFGMVRCPSYQSRPGQSDLLHLDLWWDSINLAVDSGTYSYNDQQRWGDFLRRTAAHNTVTVDDKDPMTSVRKFQWTKWPKTKVLGFGEMELEGSPLFYWAGEHRGYAAVRHQRKIISYLENWVVIDDIIAPSRNPRSYTLRWHLSPELEWENSKVGLSSKINGIRISIEGPGDQVFIGASENQLPETGVSLHYGEIQAGALLKICNRTDRSFRWVTRIGSSNQETLGKNILSKIEQFDCKERT